MIQTRMNNLITLHVSQKIIFNSSYTENNIFAVRTNTRFTVTRKSDCVSQILFSIEFRCLPYLCDINCLFSVIY